MEDQFYPETLYIEEAIYDDPLVQRVLQRFPSCPVVPIQDHRRIQVPEKNLHSKTMKAKGSLALARKKGDWVKAFPHHPALLQSREYYLLHGLNCVFDCSYCYLQHYHENAVPTLFVNQEEMVPAIIGQAGRSDGKESYFHAGEMADSLALDDISRLSPLLVATFSELPNARLELRTKSTRVHNLRYLDHRERTVVSWTFSPESIARRYESRAPSLSERIKAAVECQSWGYPVGLRLDPVFFYPGWESDYREMLEEIFSSLSPEGIESCHLGGFRYPLSLEKILRERFPASPLLLEEFVPCADGKFRYFRPLRVGIYKKLISWVHSFDPGIKIYLSMETPEVWRSVFHG